MPLTAKQRARLPRSAFALPSKRKYPVPTKAQAKRAGIPETTRLNLHRNALARAGQKGTAGTYGTIARKVRARSGGKVKTVARKTGTVTRPGTRRKRRK